MGPVPQLSTYEQAARSYYEPLKTADANALKATRDTTKNSLESEKGQINTDYSTALQNLKDSITSQTGQINQLYNQRLLGNISGLQGNDMGMMFSRANQQQSNIEQTRANKLNSIATAEGNADIAYNTGVANLAPKYASAEAKYAQDAYGSAVKDYNDTNYKQQQLDLQRYRAGETARHNAAMESNAASKVDPLKEFGDYIATQFKRAGGQGNSNVSRQQQDAWANEWFDAHGVDPANRQAYWNLFNTTYNRTEDPTKDWRYAR